MLLTLEVTKLVGWYSFDAAVERLLVVVTKPVVATLLGNNTIYPFGGVASLMSAVLDTDLR